MSKRTFVMIFLITLLLAACGGSPDLPPRIYLISNGGLVDGFQSSYCWDQGLQGVICMDTMAPFFDTSTELAGGEPIRLQLDAPLPQGLTLSLSPEVFGDTIISESVAVTELVEWSPPISEGEYILIAHASWKQGEVSYWFSISRE